MKKALKTAMMTSISEVLETMFFLPLEFRDQETFETSSIPTIACEIGFQGMFSGRFTLFIPEKLLLNMTKNFMGMNQDAIIGEHTSGTIKETLNMLAGGTLSNFNNQLEFQLTIPEIVNMDKTIVLGQDAGREEIVSVAETTEGCLALTAVIESGSVE